MALDSFGATFTWNSQAVAQLDTIGGFKLAIGSRETTYHKTTDRFRTFAAGLVTAENIPISGHFVHDDTNGQIAMIADAAAGTARAFSVGYPAASGTTFSGTGFIAAIEVGQMDVEGNIPFTAEITPTVAPTFATSSVSGMSACAVSGAGTVIAPTFGVGVYEYVVDVANAVSSVTFTCTSTETITLTYGSSSQSLTTTVASAAVALTAGALLSCTVTISDTGKAAKVYKFHVVRAAA